MVPRHTQLLRTKTAVTLSAGKLSIIESYITHTKSYITWKFNHWITSSLRKPRKTFRCPRCPLPAQFWQRLWAGKVGLHTSVSRGLICAIQWSTGRFLEGEWVSPSVTFPKGISGEFQVTSPWKTASSGRKAIDLGKATQLYIENEPPKRGWIGFPSVLIFRNQSDESDEIHHQYSTGTEIQDLNYPSSR